jgi:hypothetical protein
VVRNETWGGEESYGGRAKLLWEPSEGLSVYLIGDYSKITRTGPGQLWTLKLRCKSSYRDHWPDAGGIIRALDLLERQARRKLEAPGTLR